MRRFSSVVVTLGLLALTLDALAQAYPSRPIPFIVPAGTPQAVIERVNVETRKALVSATVKEQFAAQGLEASPSTPQEFGAYLKSEVAKWGRVIKASGAKPE